MGHKSLKEHIQKGYTINRHRVKANYEEFMKAVADVKSISAGSIVDKDSVLELITLFADTWFSLDAYDRDTLIAKGTTKKKVTLIGLYHFAEVIIHNLFLFLQCPRGFIPWKIVFTTNNFPSSFILKLHPGFFGNATTCFTGNFIFLHTSSIDRFCDLPS